MTQTLVALAVAGAAVAVALVLRSRRAADAPTQVRHELPTQLDRGDFPAATEPWLVVVFSSATCHTCADMVRKAEVLRSADVAVVDVEFNEFRALHAKYAVQAVPILVIADQAGTVRAGFAGPASATDVWAAVAEVRDPGSTPRPIND